MPKSTPRRPGKPGQNRDSRDGVFGHPESQVGPLPSVGLYARVSTPHQHTIGMQLRQLREFLERRRWQEVLVVEEVVSRSRQRPGERPSTRRCAAARDRHHPERNLPISGPAGSLRVIFHTVAAQAPGPFGGDALRPLTSACSHLFKESQATMKFPSRSLTFHPDGRLVTTPVLS